MNTKVLEKWPVTSRHERAVGWLAIRADLGRAPQKINASTPAAVEYLGVCERDRVDLGAANRPHLAAFVKRFSAAAVVRTWSGSAPGAVC